MIINGMTFVEQHRAESPTISAWGDNETNVAATFDVIQDDANPNYILQSDIAKTVLHYATYDQTSRKILRHMPMCLEDCEWLFATKITNMHGIGAAQIILPNAATRRNGFDHFKWAAFRHYRCTVLFQSLPFEVLPDSQVTKEHQRWVERFATLGIDQRQRRQGQYYYGNGPQGPPNPASFPMGLIQRTPVNHIQWVWRNVPHRAVFLPNGVLSPNISRCLGRVNKLDWPLEVGVGDPGFAGDFQVNIQGDNNPPRTCFRKNTLLLTQVATKASEAPVRPLATGTLTSTVPRCWDITFSFDHLDPLLDPSYNYSDFGHQLVPSTLQNSDTAFYSYVATAKNDGTGPRLYVDADMDLLFTPL